MQYKTFRILIVFFLFWSLALLSGYYFGRKGFEVSIDRNKNIPLVVTQKQEQAKIDNSNISFDLFWKVWDVLDKKYLLKPISGKDMVYGAIKGMTESLGDPYTTFLIPTENKSFSEALNGKYQGIGCELGKDEQGLIIVISPLEGSPAMEAGLKPKDKIIKINGENATNISVNSAVNKIRGPENTTVTLNILRGAVDDPNNKPFDVSIVRRQIVLKAVEWKDKGEGIAYIKVGSFGEDTNKEWDKAVLDIKRQMPNLKGVVVDVRNNPGGYLMGAVHLAGEFLQGGTVAFQEDYLGNTVSLDGDRVGSFNKIKVVVLINGGSASASEILAGALRDRVGAKLVGEKSFGKGTIQDSEDFPDGSSIHVTIAKWLTPNKTWVHKVGLTPDVEVANDEKTQDVDEQVEKAVETVKQIK